ncbi:CDP-archaeol synthase [Lysobacter sp. CCNWLW3]|uniref:CDP-archaeol synthase n=1 Tax=unclassified Lysobacter TaxID=2635362 RepID=UPI002FD513F4
MTELASRLLQLLYFMAPAYFANMAPPFVRYWKGWNRPIHARSLGDHKTVVGFALGVLAAVATTAAQAAIDAPISLVDYAHRPWLGLAFGLGAMTGDSLKSYFKRRRGLPSGARWIPFDQLDFVLGALLLVGPSAGLGWFDVLAILLATLAGDIAVNRAAFRLGIKATPW